MINTKSCFADRLLLIGGLSLVTLTMILGVIYAAVISHVANSIIKQSWADVMTAVVNSDVEMVKQQFALIAEMTEKRGRVMNSHSHLGACGLLALVLATLQPLCSLSSQVRNMIACFIIVGALMQFSGVFFGYYLSQGFLLVSDVGALMLLFGVGATLYGLLVRKPSGHLSSLTDVVIDQLRFASSRLLLKAGALLILVCMLLGLYIAWLLVSGNETKVYDAMAATVTHLMQQDVTAAKAAIAQFKTAQSKMTINAASHSHGIIMGFVMILVALNRQSINFPEKIVIRLSQLFVLTGFMNWIFIFLAINYAFIFAIFADTAGGILCLTLLVILFGMIRNNGKVEHAR